MDETFSLHPQLAGDSVLLGVLSLCQVRLMNNARHPWLILVPERGGLHDLDQLAANDAARLHADLQAAARALRTLFAPDKLNVAALGNIVPQLHVHVVARFTHDAAWPAPVWGALPPQPYRPEELQELKSRLQSALGLG
ncbi:MAG: HIT family protein [Magnetococcus sp. WYHC-3]